MRLYDRKKKASEYIKEYRLHKIWKKITAVLAALTAIVVAALLVLPAITMERNSMDFSEYIEKISVEKAVDGQWTPADGSITSGDSIRMTLRYHIPEGIVTQDSRIIHYQLPSGIGLSQEEGGDVTVDSGSKVGTYTIDTNGLIKIQFDEVFADGSAFTGSLTFQGTVTASGEQGEDKIDFGDAGGTITVVPKKDEYDLSIQKQGNYNKDAQIIEYGILVSSEKGSDGPITVTDVFQSENIQYDRNSQEYPFTIRGTGGKEITGYQLTFHEGSPASFTVTGLPQLKAGESYTITYAAIPDFASADSNGYLQFTNTATAKDNTNTVAAKVNIVVSRAMISKEGTYNSVTRMVEWTVKLNEDLRDIRGYTLNDTLTCVGEDGRTYQVNMPKLVTITAYLGNDPIGESQQVRLPYTFPNLSEPYNTCQYVVTYETELPGDAPEGTALTFINDAWFGEYSTSIEVPVTVPGERTYDVVKNLESTENGEQIMNWNSLISYPQNGDIDIENLTYMDWAVDMMREESEPFISKSHYMTAELLEKTVITSLSGEIRLEAGTDYTIYGAPHNVMDDYNNAADGSAFLLLPFSDVDKFVGERWRTLEELISAGESQEPLALMKVVFTKSALEKLNGQSILIKYQTRVDTEKLPLNTQITLMNLAKIPGDFYIASVNHTLKERLNKQVSPTGLIEGSNDTSSYTDDPLTLNSGDIGNLLHYRILVSDFHQYDLEPGALTVTDTLPAGAELVEDSVTLCLHPSGDDFFTDSQTIGWYLKVSTQKNADETTTVTFTISHIGDFAGDQFGIYYDVSIAADPTLESAGTATYENKAEWDGETDSTTTHVKHTKPRLTKTGEYLKLGDHEDPVSSDILRYYVTVNPDGIKLNPYDTKLILEDTLTIPNGSSAVLLPTNVKLYKYDPSKEENHFCGERITPSDFKAEYDNENQFIRFTLPDSTACVLVYDYAIDRGTVVGDMDIRNTVTLTGRDSYSSDKEIKIEEQQSSATVDKTILTFFKHESGNLTILLEGAKFRLERYEQIADGSYDWVQTSITAGEDGLFVTDRFGNIVLNFLSEEYGGSMYNTLYRLTEVEAPAGYLLSDQKYYFVWMEEGYSQEQTIEKMQQSGAFGDVSPDLVHFLDYGELHTEYIPNEPDQLTVVKKWRSDTGELLQDPSVDQVTVTLYQWADGKKAVYGTAELSAEKDWTYSWIGLPKKTDDGRECHYTVEEEPIPGFTVTYSDNNQTGIQTGTIEIVNTQAGYVLPETGGNGTNFFTIAGTLLIGVFGVGYYFYLRRRHGKEGDAS